MGREQSLDLPLRIWGYRNVWHRFKLGNANIAVPVTAKAMHDMHQTFIDCFGSQREAEFPSPEYDGPFSVLSQRFHTKQLKEYKILLGSRFFEQHPNEIVRHADGLILIKEMSEDQFLKGAADLRSKIE